MFNFCNLFIYLFIYLVSYLLIYLHVCLFVYSFIINFYSSVGQLRGIDPTTHHTMSGRSTTELHLASRQLENQQKSGPYPDRNPREGSTFFYKHICNYFF